MKFLNIPTVFMSYREPNAEDNYETLYSQNRNTLRVTGVKGYDAAHRAALSAAVGFDPETKYIITIDADNEVLSHFWTLDTEDAPASDDRVQAAMSKGVLSWNSYNPLTGLHYGNGGVKLWSRSFLENIKTHEAVGSNDPVVDFCWNDNYVQLASIQSRTLPHVSAKQAFAAGYREGAKMGLQNGKLRRDGFSLTQTNRMNTHRLIRWCSVGEHLPNGPESIRGALLGLVEVFLKRSVPLEKISDLDYLYQLQSTPRPPANELREIVKRHTGLHIPTFGPTQSRYVVEASMPTRSPQPFEIESWITPQP